MKEAKNVNVSYNFELRSHVIAKRGNVDDKVTACVKQTCLLGVIECFHSRGQQQCKFFGTKGSVCIRKEFNSHRTGLCHQHGRRFIVLGH